MNIIETIERILSVKKAKGISPVQVDMLELHKEGLPIAGLKEQMRQLVRAGYYDGSITINKIPILRPRKK